MSTERTFPPDAPAAPSPSAPTQPVLRPARADRWSRAKRYLIGKPLRTEQLAHERLGKPTALAVFASDNLSSSAYATEEILRVLLVSGLGAAAFTRVVPITIALLGVLAVLLFSYRQTIRAYPQAGGAYLVTRDNFGVLPAQVAGVALLTDYILTVSVSVAAGTAALTSLQPSLHSYRVPVSIAFVVLLCAGNLRGVRESGRLFAAPTYFFIGMMFTLLGVGAWRFLAGTLPENASQFSLPPTRPVAGLALVFLILKAFASGGAAVTGVEAISNGVPAFRPPEWRHARTTLMWMGVILGAMFFGLSFLAAHLHVGVDEHEKITVTAQIAKAVFGPSGAGHALFTMLQLATLLILVLAANTSYADFPRLASFHAADRFLPRQLTRYGDRLVFSNGILVLSALSIVLLVIFDASVTRLIPLYALGVFTSFTFSQLGMAKRHLTRRESGWRVGLAINGAGGVVSGVMAIIIGVVKFTSGAWMMLACAPLVLFGLLKVNKHYEETGKTLRNPQRLGARDVPRQTCIIPVGRPGPNDRYAVEYARRMFPFEIRLVHFAKPGTTLESLMDGWGHLGESVEMEVSRGSTPDDIVRFVRRIRESALEETLVNVLIPETIRRLGPAHLLRRFHVQRIKAALVSEASVVVTSVAHHPGYETLEPLRSTNGSRPVEGWCHVAVVLVSAVHNATARALRYARSLRADELHCIHVAVDEHEATKVATDWEKWNLHARLEVLPSPYRQIERPVHEWVRELLENRPRTFVTVVIPEFVPRKRWHQFMHNQTALTLKAAFLFEPSVVVSSVPYRL